MDNAVARTIDGLVPVTDLGIVLAHEHLSLDLRSWQAAPASSDEQKLADAPLTMPILGEVRRNPLMSIDNLILDDEKAIIDDLRDFRSLGGRTVVDLTVRGLSPRIDSVRRIAHEADVHVIAGCGYYIRDSHPREVAADSVESLTDRIVREVIEGFCDGSGVLPGVIGEIGTSQPVHPAEWKVLEAACRAQRQTGLPLFVHVYPMSPTANTAPEVARFILERGVEPSRTVLCHMDAYPNATDILDVAALGMYISFDGFGLESYYTATDEYRIRDFERETHILKLLEAGHEERLLISQDVCMKMQLRKYGGCGYAHILRHIVPDLKRRGVSDATLETLLVQNPARVLAIPCQQAT